MPLLVSHLTDSKLAIGLIPAIYSLGYYLLQLFTASFAYDMIAKVIPVRWRGLFSGVSHGLGALLGVAGAVLVGWILASWPYPRDFSLCFSLAFVAMAISWVGLALNREPKSPTVKPPSSLRHYLGQLPGILRRNRNYVRFLVSRVR